MQILATGTEMRMWATILAMKTSTAGGKKNQSHRNEIPLETRSITTVRHNKRGNDPGNAEDAQREISLGKDAGAEDPGRSHRPMSKHRHRTLSTCPLPECQGTSQIWL